MAIHYNSITKTTFKLKKVFNQILTGYFILFIQMSINWLKTDALNHITCSSSTYLNEKNIITMKHEIFLKRRIFKKTNVKIQK